MVKGGPWKSGRSFTLRKQQVGKHLRFLEENEKLNGSQWIRRSSQPSQHQLTCPSAAAPQLCPLLGRVLSCRHSLSLLSEGDWLRGRHLRAERKRLIWWLQTKDRDSTDEMRAPLKWSALVPAMGGPSRRGV